MFMPKLGTMHLRNKLASSRVVSAFFFLIFCGLLAAQTSSAPSPSNQTTVPQVQQPSQAPPPTSPSNQAPTTQPPAAQEGTPQVQTPAAGGAQADATDNVV